MGQSKMQTDGSVMGIVGGKLVQPSYSSNLSFPLNGQQLMMQLDNLTSSMMEMAVSQDTEMEEVMDDQTLENKEQSSEDFPPPNETLSEDSLHHDQQLYLLQQQQKYQQLLLDQEKEHQRQLLLEQQGRLLQPKLNHAEVNSCIPSQKCIIWA